MNNSELDHLLQSAPTPEREAGYWETFPRSVTVRLGTGQSSAFRRPVRRPSSLLLGGLGFATACVVIGLAIGFWQGRASNLHASQVAGMQKFFREVEALFPNQVRAIILDERGPRLVLSEKADVPASTPLWLKISSPSGSQSVLTFSGQQIPVDGDACDVLIDAGGHVLVVGSKLVWSSAARGLPKTPYHIQAQSLL